MNSAPEAFVPRSAAMDSGEWPVPEPAVPAGTDAVLAEAARAAAAAFREARGRYSRAELGEKVEMGADGTATMRLDVLVDGRIVDVASAHGVNVLSEEIGVVDHGSARTLVVDPVDGTANAVAGVPLSAFSAAIVVDGVAREALTCWLDTGRCWHAVAGAPTPYRTSGRTTLDGAAVSLLRPHARNADAWWRVTRRAERVRILSSSCLEAALVTEGAVDAFADAGSDTHRLMDLVAAMVLVPAAGGVVCDAFGRPLEIHPDLTRRWSGVVAASAPLAEQLCAEIAAGTAELSGAQLTELIDGLAGLPYGGEAVDQRAHALQTAWHAVQAEADDELILAAALHDIGRARQVRAQFPDAAHEESGALFAQRYISERTGWLIAQHVPAKRYLVATDPGYAATLSPVSVASLRVQGGPMSPAEIADFDAHPDAADAVRLRRWDDAAKDPAAPTLPLQQVLDAYTRVCGRRTAQAYRG